MKLLVVALDDYKPRSGGIAELTHALAEGMVDQGHQVEVLSRSMEGADVFDRGCPYPVHRTDLPRVSVLKPHGTYRAFRAVRHHIDRLDPDAVLCNVIGHRGYLSALAASHRGVPFVLLAHGNELTQPDRRPDALRDRLFWTVARRKRDATLKRADRVVCNSGFTESVVRSLGVPDSRTAVVPPGCDPAPAGVDPGGLPQPLAGIDLAGRPLLVTIGRLVPRKGIDRTLEAIEHVIEEHPDLLYVVAGDGADRGRLERMVANRDLEGTVVLAGYVTEDEKHALYGAADVFVMPSRERQPGPRTGLPRSYEGFGIVYLEAAVHGIPSIAGRAGGVVDAVEDGETGLIVDPKDPHAIADAIRQLVEHPERADQMGQAARRRATERFTWEHATSRLVAVLEQLTG